MGQAELPKCPDCGNYLTLAPPPEGKGKPTFQCFDCDRPDPMETEKAIGWLIQPPKDPRAADDYTAHSSNLVACSRLPPSKHSTPRGACRSSAARLELRSLQILEALRCDP
jgi:hypothetical protein